MSLKATITEDMKSALKAKETQRLSAIRLLLAAVKQREVDERIELGDADVLGIVEKLIKQRRDSIAQFQAANRQDLVDAETFELNVLSGYLPKQLSEAEVGEEIAKAIAETGAKAMQDMGKVMGLLKARLAGKADMGKISGMVRARLSGAAVVHTRKKPLKKPPGAGLAAGRGGAIGRAGSFSPTRLDSGIVQERPAQPRRHRRPD